MGNHSVRILSSARLRCQIKPIKIRPAEMRTSKAKKSDGCGFANSWLENKGMSDHCSIDTRVDELRGKKSKSRKAKRQVEDLSIHVGTS